MLMRCVPSELLLGLRWPYWSLADRRVAEDHRRIFIEHEADEDEQKNYRDGHRGVGGVVKDYKGTVSRRSGLGWCADEIADVQQVRHEEGAHCVSASGTVQEGIRARETYISINLNTQTSLKGIDQARMRKFRYSQRSILFTDLPHRRNLHTHPPPSPSPVIPSCGRLRHLVWHLRPHIHDGIDQVINDLGPSLLPNLLDLVQ